MRFWEIYSFLPSIAGIKVTQVSLQSLSFLTASNLFLHKGVGDKCGTARHIADFCVAASASSTGSHFVGCGFPLCPDTTRTEFPMRISVTQSAGAVVFHAVV